MALVRRTGLFLVSYAPLAAMFVAAKWPGGWSAATLARCAAWIAAAVSLLVLPLAAAFFTRGRKKLALAAVSLIAGFVTAVGVLADWFRPLEWDAPKGVSSATAAGVAFALCVAGVEIALVIVLNARQTSALHWKIADPRDQGGAVAGYLATYLLPLLSVNAHGWNTAVAYTIYLLTVYVIFVRSENLVLVNPTLYLLGFRVFDVELDPPAGLGTKRRVLLLSRGPITKETDINAFPLGDDCYLAAREIKEAA
jgi:hypothetical protein